MKFRGPFCPAAIALIACTMLHARAFQQRCDGSLLQRAASRRSAYLRALLCHAVQPVQAGRADSQVNTADVSGTSNRQGNLQQQHPTLAATANLEQVALGGMPRHRCAACRQLAWQQSEQMPAGTASKVGEPLFSSLPHCLTSVALDACSMSDLAEVECWWSTTPTS